ncbi:hypothetical protein L6R53_12275 [Myxococcota bacterium]|nr:hypothetical protein [Myxococcota bacterium]
MTSPTIALRRIALPALLALSAGCNDYALTQFQAQDIFNQEPAGEVDILLVVDNSCSMDPYQAKLAANFDNFLTYLEEGQVDYNIGVLTTSVEVPDPIPQTECTAEVVADIPSGGSLVGGTIIRSDTENADQVFSDLVNVGICGNGYEMGLESAYMAVTPPLSTSENFNFLRGSAMLSMIFVSDEEDSSPLPVSDYINTFRNVKGLDDRSAFNASALVVNDTADCNQQQIQSGATPGTRYIDVASETDGLLANICADDFADILTELSLRASRLRDTFYLTRLPDPASLFLTIDGVEVPCDAGQWTYQTEGEGADMVGKIVFERASLPPPNSLVTVTYDYGSGDPAGFCTGSTGATAE